MPIPPSAAGDIDKENHWAILGFVRFLLATWVLFAHVRNFLPPGVAVPPIPDANAVTAVLLFFAISGYSIRHSIEHRPKGYWARRFWRIAPVYVVCLLLAAIGYLFIGDKSGVPKPMVWVGTLLLLQCFVAKYVGVLYPAWSLSIEAFYYLTPPVLRRLPSWVPAAALIISGLFCAYRMYFMSGYVGNDTHGISLLALYWAWVAGWIAQAAKGSWSSFLLLAGVGAFVVAVDPQHSPEIGSSKSLTAALDALFWIVTIYYMCFVEALRLPMTLRMSFNYLGELSYPLYLVHWPLFTFVRNGLFIQHPTCSSCGLLVGLALLFSALIYAFFDRPMRSGRLPWMLAAVLGLLIIFVGLARGFRR